MVAVLQMVNKKDGQDFTEQVQYSIYALEFWILQALLHNNQVE